MNFMQLAAELEAFADERDWGQFHSPKNLSMALIAEAAELAAHFQWLSETQSQDLDERSLAAVRNEIADVQIYLARLADRLGVDIESAVRDKLADNARKYPAERVRGSTKKYSEYPDEGP
jgi:NTP pyrophosphatase (non-canonical NTP hydrolase)